MNVLLSIKPVYVDEIVKGNKKYEFRRIIFKNKKIKRIYIYATAPVGKIVASFAVRKVIEDSPTALWRKCRRSAGISRKDFFEYFKGAKRAFAIQIGLVEHFDEPVDPFSVIEDFTAPQSFFYLPPSIPELDPQDRRLTDF
jgi:type I restriction enzyme S subunit